MNNGDSNTRRDGEEPKAPAKLAAALKEPPARRAFVPPAVDAAILRAARQHFGSTSSLALSDGERVGVRGTFAWLLRPRIVWPTVATACLALIGLIHFASRPSQPQFAREDVNRDGHVDILDAFQLARETQSGASSTGVDLNEDGRIDRRDAELIATRAVKLEKGGKS